MAENNLYGYPDSQIDPRLKNYDWILQFVKAAYYDNRGFIPSTPLNSGQSKMQEIKEYALGQQSINKYKKELLADEQQDTTWQAIDWTPLALLPKYREIAISKMFQEKYDIQAFAVDPLAKSEEDDYFNKMKVKIMLREEAMKMGDAGKEIADNPILKPQLGEPQDMEQLAMEQNYGYKHIMSMEAEELNTLIMQQNDGEELRKRTVEYLYDFGIGGYTQWIDENGMVKVREINPEQLVMSYCSKNNFSDLTHWGEIIEVYVGDLAPYFTEEQLKTIVQSVAGKYGNPSNFAYGADLSKYWNRFKVLVLDFKFLSWNTTYYKNEIDGRGNTRFNKTKFQTIGADGILRDEYKEPFEETGSKGNEDPKFMDITRKVMYKCKWLIQTDFMYDYGLSENMVRKPSSWWDTTLDVQLYSWNFYKMKFSGITERLIPLEDKACLTWYKLQNLTNKLVPYLINLDLTAFEGVNFGKGGGNATPSEIIDFIFTNFVVPHRSHDLLRQNPNYKPVSIEASGQLALFTQLYEDLNNTIAMMRQVSGLNEVTDASTPNAKNLNSTNAAAMQSTNNALFLIQNADKQLIVKLADANIAKGQIAVKLGKVSGYRKALGQETVSFLQINPNISNHEFGIFLEDAPSEEQRQMFWQNLNNKEYQGLIEPEDKILIMSVRNLKQADIVLAYRIKKRKEAAQAAKMQEIQAQQQGQAQIQMQAEQMKQQTLQMQSQLAMQLENLKGEWLWRIESMKKENDANEAHIQAQSKIVSNQVMAKAKTDSANIAAGSHITGTHMKNQADMAMTEMGNETKKQTKK